MELPFVNIHTHRPTGRGIELRTAGIHPWEADKADIQALEQHLTHAQAVGETGLDLVHGPTCEVQEEAFRSQLALARKYTLPVVIHCVRAFEPVMRLLAEYTPRAVIFHGFIGSSQQMQQAVAKGYFLSFGERAFASPRTCEALRETPSENLFLETDDSAVTIGEIYARAADTRGETVDELLRSTNENYQRIFGNG